MKRNIYFSLITFFLLALHGYGQQKQDISVLYVGYSAAKPIPTDLKSVRITGGASNERFKEEYGKRMPAFKNLLDTYFTMVQTVDARDYKETMSLEYDVTIFDEAPTPLSGRGGRAKYISDDFNSAAIFIGHTSSTIGRSYGSKLDWYCLCLDRHAHHINTEHAIFRGPYKTDITLKNGPTPNGVLKAYNGKDVPKEIPMWEVDREGYEDGKGFRVGMVARAWGFEEGGNAEIISSGVCTKDKSAVALGRHGNFFLWGFAGSPDYMTEEAKVVFANTVVYTNAHADDKIIVRKYNERIATREYVDQLLFYTTKRAYLSKVKTTKERNAAMSKEAELAKKKLAEGKTLTEEEQYAMGSKPSEIPTRQAFLTRSFRLNPWAKESLGLDTLAIRKYLTENLDYIYSEPDKSFALKVDEDIKSLNMANTDIKLLDKAIGMLEQGIEVDKAHRILMRYTLESFIAAEEWRAWYEKNHSNMFFSEAGGYIWLINDADANPKIKPRTEKDIAALRFQ